MLKVHSEAVPGLITSSAEAASQRTGSGMGETPKSGRDGLAAAGLTPQNLQALNAHLLFQAPPTLVVPALSSAREPEPAFG